MIALIATGTGNLRNVQRAFARLDVLTEPTADPEIVAAARRIVLPGQGAFGDCMAALAGPLADAIKRAVGAGTPFLGICLGMQVLFEESEEAPGVAGLDILPGEVRRLPRRHGGFPVALPHMGWNRVRFAGAPAPAADAPHFYFAHSYAAVPACASDVWGTTDYGGEFVSAVRSGNVWGVQFHPEKSHEAGATFLREWLAACPPKEGE